MESRHGKGMREVMRTTHGHGSGHHPVVLTTDYWPLLGRGILWK